MNTDPAPFRPGPAATPADLVEELRRLRARTGAPSLRELRRIAEHRRTEPLPPSTLSEILGGKRLPRLPRLELLQSYVAACLSAAHLDDHLINAELPHWHALWRALAEPSAPRRRPPPRPWLTAAAVFTSGLLLGAAGTYCWESTHPAPAAVVRPASR